MFRIGMEWVDFVYGDSKRGIAHIIKGRTEKHGMTALQVNRLLTEGLIETIASGTETRRVSA
jgi:hypothetical protein